MPVPQERPQTRGVVLLISSWRKEPHGLCAESDVEVCAKGSRELESVEGAFGETDRRGGEAVSSNQEGLFEKRERRTPVKKMTDPDRSKEIQEKLSRKIGERSGRLAERMLIRTEDGRDPYDLDFSEREALAERLGKEIASVLLEENLSQDAWREIVEEAVSWECPRCGKDSPRHKDDDGNEAYEQLELKTKAGMIRADIRLFRCGKCRKIFSPLPPENQSRS